MTEIAGLQVLFMCLQSLNHTATLPLRSFRAAYLVFIINPAMWGLVGALQLKGGCVFKVLAHDHHTCAPLLTVPSVAFLNVLPGAVFGVFVTWWLSDDPPPPASLGSWA